MRAAGENRDSIGFYSLIRCMLAAILVWLPVKVRANSRNLLCLGSLEC